MKKRINKHKRQKIQQNEPGDTDGNDNSDGNHNDDNSTTSNSGVEGPVNENISTLGANDDDESVDETEENAKPHSNGIDSTLDGTYWNNGTVGTKTD